MNRSTNKGMLAYFAARAPKEPQFWFKPKMEIDEPDFKDEKRSAWTQEYGKQRYIQWPFAWARAVLAREDELLTATRKGCKPHGEDEK